MTTIIRCDICNKSENEVERMLRPKGYGTIRDLCNKCTIELQDNEAILIQTMKAKHNVR